MPPSVGREKGIGELMTHPRYRLKGRSAIACVVLLATAALAPATARAQAGTLSSGDFTGPAGTQHYELYVPSSYKKGTAAPLVVALHGCTQTADQFRELTQWDKLAEAKGFLVVFPEQNANSNSQKCWNFFQGEHMQRGSGEPAEIADLTTWVEQNYTVNPDMVYVNGLSAGGAMASVMATTYPDLYAAVGIGSGCEYAATAGCAGSKSAPPVQAGQSSYQVMGAQAHKMPFIVFEGDADTTVPPVNAAQVVEQWQVTNDWIDDGANNGSVPRAPTSTTTEVAPGGRSYTLNSYGDGHGAELGQFWLVGGMGHAWSGGCSCQSYSDPAGPDETAAMYAFFVAHPAHVG
jgi:poly(hydroxyalkanoate) depolymerase family esterase